MIPYELRDDHNFRLADYELAMSDSEKAAVLDEISDQYPPQIDWGTFPRCVHLVNATLKPGISGPRAYGTRILKCAWAGLVHVGTLHDLKRKYKDEVEKMELWADKVPRPDNSCVKDCRFDLLREAREFPQHPIRKEFLEQVAAELESPKWRSFCWNYRSTLYPRMELDWQFLREAGIERDLLVRELDAMIRRYERWPEEGDGKLFRHSLEPFRANWDGNRMIFDITRELP